MKWHPIDPKKKSHIAAVAHDGKNLHVRFAGGQEGYYENVPTSRMHEVAAADSPGKYLHAHVIPKHKWNKKVEVKK